VFTAALALIHLALPIATVSSFVPHSYNEGWNAYHAEAVLSERPLYPEPSELFPNNYPPLSFAIVAMAGRVLGDPLRAGRLLSLVALLAIGAQIGWIATRSAGSVAVGTFAGLLFAALMGAAFGEYVGMNDPQLLAHALMLGGLMLLGEGRSRPRLFGASLLMVLAGLVKHNTMALPLALTVWLFGRDPLAFRRWVLASATLAAGAVAVLWWIFGPNLFLSVLAPRTSAIEIAARVSADWLRSLAAPIAVGLLAARECWRDRDQRLIALYAAFSLVIGFVFTSGVGVSYNAYFDLLIALSLLGPLLLAHLAVLVPAAARVIPTGALALALLVDPLIQAPDALLGLRTRLEENSRLEKVTREDVAYLTSREGPALCEGLELCFWAGKPASVDLFNSQQLFWNSVVEEGALLERVAKREFAVVQLSSAFVDRDDERVSGQLARALRTHYVVDRISANGVFLRPRGGPAADGR
jgi:hypothetical protein